ncbi:MAG: hypothetical protein RIR79_1246 [Pseudomonadota bacterium]|jgi:apolipoprotein N-acyltransferase
MVLRFTILLIAAYAHAAGVSWSFHAIFPYAQGVGWLQIAALAVLVLVLRQCRSAKHAALAGWWFATAWLASTFWWLYISLHVYGGLDAILTVLSVTLLAGLLALYYAAACAAFWRFSSGWTGWASSFLFAALWTAAELARGTWLTGFGWGAVGYAHIDSFLSSLIPWIGSYGVGMVAALLAALLAGFVANRQIIPIALLLMGGFGFGLQQVGTWATWSQSSGKLSVTLLQGNIPQDEKFQKGSGIPLALAWYAQELNASPSDLVVAPETAIPLLPDELPESYWNALQTRFATGKQAAMLGIPMGNYEKGYTNSMLGFAPEQAAPWQYDKHHLVPFGEFIPPAFKWFMRLMHIPLGDFNRGELGQPSFEWKNQRLAANICYEDLFGEELGVRFIEAAASPTIFVNISNIGWFGDSIAMHQHLQISRMRALEFERPMIRATNTGMTAIINHQGQVTHALTPLTRGALMGVVEGRNGITPFAWWVSRLGLLPLWVLLITIVLIAARAYPMRATP